eukprot:Gb_06637 [translate_table: standard]
MSNHKPQGSHRTARVSTVHHSSSYWLGKDANWAKENVNRSNPGQTTDLSPSKRVMVVVDLLKKQTSHCCGRSFTWYTRWDPQEPQRRLDAKACETANSIKAMCRLHRPEGHATNTNFIKPFGGSKKPYTKEL